jgi:parvulin-like peptidyl-prolyl isomerase
MRADFGARARWRSALFFVVWLPVVTAAGLLVSGCGSKPVAEVNGQALTEKEFQRRCESAINVSNQATVGIQVLTNWITAAIQEQQAKQLKVYPSAKELDARMEAIKSRLAFNGQPLEKLLVQRGQTLEGFRQGMLEELVTENVLTNGVTVTDDEVRKQFDAQASNFGKPELVKISQITVDSLATAKQAHTELAGNAQFGVVASTHSKDIFAQQNGRVQGEWPKQIQPGLPISQEAITAAFKLQPGQFSDPIKVGAQWVIVKLEEKLPAQKPVFDEVKELVRSELKRRKVTQSGGGQKAQEALIKAMMDADVKIHRPEYEIVATQLKELAKQGAPPTGGLPGGEGLPTEGMPPAPPGQ